MPASAAGPRAASGDRPDASPLPKSPVFDWSNLRAARPPSAALRSVAEVPHQLATTSGRAALFQALLQLQPQRGDVVLVPTYHCPSMIAPIVHAGLQARFYGVLADGSPDLAGIRLDRGRAPAALIAAHYFGLPRSLQATRNWCDRHGVVLIEDCAHCFFGVAGARPVGQWGDFAIASLTKFFPVPEAGLLVSAQRPLLASALATPTFAAQLKGWADVLEVSSRHGRLRGLNALLKPLFAAKQRLRNGTAESATDAMPPEELDPRAVPDCDMQRAAQAPLLVSRLLYQRLDRGRIYLRRRENYAAYAEELRPPNGMHALQPALPDGAAPYVFPLWVDDADRVYRALRELRMPVFRWDRVWPLAPHLDGDCAPQWRRHVLQLLCHQDLSRTDVAHVCRTIGDLAAARRAAPTRPRAEGCVVQP